MAGARPETIIKQMPDFEKIKTCRSCESVNIKPFFDLGEQPLANSLLTDKNEKENLYPLTLSFCEDCGLVQLNETVDPKILFSKYVWVTGTSRAANEFAHKFFMELAPRVSGTKGNYVLEVASNDGTFLKPFKDAGYKVIGVDPAENVVEIAQKNGIPTECEFFGEEVAKKLVRENGTAKIIFARNVLAHVANLHDFVRGLATAIDEDGVLAVEAHYAKNILEGLQYDSIYHEHLCYFTLKSIENLLRSHGFFIFDVAASPISGGAIIVYAYPAKHTLEERERVEDWRKKEEEGGTNEFASWQGFGKSALEHRDKLVKILGDSGKDGEVVGWGASARSSTMLNFAKIGPGELPIIADMNPLKQGKFTAGTHIPIESPEKVMGRDPKTVLILGWNFAEEITDILKKKFNYKGKCLIPLPNEPRII